MTKYIFFDPNNLNDIGEIVTEDEYKESMRDGFFIHPRTGEPVPNWEKHVVPLRPLPRAKFPPDYE